MPRPAGPAAAGRDRRRPTPARARPGCGSGSSRKGVESPEVALDPVDRPLHDRRRQPRRAEGTQESRSAHRLDDLDRPDPVGHRPGHAGIAQPVIRGEAGIAQIFQPARGNMGHDFAIVVPIRPPRGLLDHVEMPMSPDREKHPADPPQRLLPDLDITQRQQPLMMLRVQPINRAIQPVRREFTAGETRSVIP